MAIYADLPKLGRVKLPSGSTYALIDVDGRSMIAPTFTAEGSYNTGDHVIYGDNLYRFNSDHAAGAWTGTDASQVTVDSEIKRIETIIAGGISYVGKTTTALYDGATTNPISINGASFTASAGNLTILDRDSVAVAYATGSAYPVHTYIKNGGIYYITNAAVTATENTSITAIESKLDVVSSDPEFLFDGTTWAALGSIADGLGDLAFKDSASGTYIKPTGTGSVSVKKYTGTTKSLATTTIVGTNGTVSASKISAVTTGAFATVGSEVAVATAGENVTVATQGSEVAVGNADVGTAKAVGTALGGTTSFNTDAIKDAELTGTTSFNTDAIKSAALTGTKTFTTNGVTTSVDGDCLTFANSSTGTVGIETAAASKASVGIETTAASKASVTLTTENILPAKALTSASTKVRQVGGTVTITPVGGTETITQVGGSANAVTGVTHAEVAAAKVASAATTVATGSLTTGSDLVTGLTESSETATVTVGTTSETVTVR